MTQQAKDILLQVAADTETMYNQGVLDGITLIKNMLSEQIEDGTEWTVDLIIETCDAFIEKYTNSEDGLPDIPNLIDEVPELPTECKDAGMTEDEYGDLMAFLNENTESEGESTPEIIPLNEINGLIVEEEKLDYERMAHNNVEAVGVSDHPMDIEHAPVIVNTNIPDVEIVKGPWSVTPEEVDISNLPHKPEEPVKMDIADVLKDAVIRTEDGEEIKLADCIAEVEE